jgi:hypothetical protein
MGNLETIHRPRSRHPQLSHCRLLTAGDLQTPQIFHILAQPLDEEYNASMTPSLSKFYKVCLAQTIPRHIVSLHKNNKLSSEFRDTQPWSYWMIIQGAWLRMLVFHSGEAILELLRSDPGILWPNTLYPFNKTMKSFETHSALSASI